MPIHLAHSFGDYLISTLPGLLNDHGIARLSVRHDRTSLQLAYLSYDLVVKLRRRSLLDCPSEVTNENLVDTDFTALD
jgi:hypothetical protein